MEIAQQPQQGTFRFAEFEFNAAKDELCLWQTGQIEKLEPQVSQLLAMLINNAQQVISKEHIQTALWPNTIVEQNSLYQLLTKLRKLLNDSSRSPKFIKTVPKKGYCFIAEVELIKDQPSMVKTIERTRKIHPLVAVLPILIVCFSV